MNKIIIFLVICALSQVTIAQRQRAQQTNKCAPACRTHGTCIRSGVAGQGSSFFCRCDAGWTGRSCDKEVQCPIKCTPNGRCLQLTQNARPSCSCDPGWTGIDCGTMLDNCVIPQPGGAATITACGAIANAPLVITECLSVLNGYICLPPDSYGSCVTSGNKVTCDLQDFTK